METFADRLSSLIGGERQISAFARKCGLGDTTLRQYLNGAMPRLDKLIQLSIATGVSIEWLATGEGPREAGAVMQQSSAGGMRQAITVSHAERDLARDSGHETSHVEGTQQEHRDGLNAIVKPDQLDSDLVFLPRLNVKASAGTGIVPEAEAMTGFIAFHQRYLRDIGINPRFAHTLQVEGDSMAPTLGNQDWVIVDTSIDRVLTDALYAVVYAGAVLVKRIQLMRDGSIILSSDNKDAGYIDERVTLPDLPDLHVVGRVRGHFRMF